jgi:hypothetical protein
LHYDGREWITFAPLPPIQPPLRTGKYMVGTLTIHCESEEGCATPLEFIEGSTLFDDTGMEVSATWVNGTFTCEVPPPECLGDCYSGPVTGSPDCYNCTGDLVDTNVPCITCLGVAGQPGIGLSWKPTTRCPGRDLWCPDCCYGECPNCCNGIDDDGDGLIDCPADDGCACCCDYTEEPEEGKPCVPELPTIALTGIGMLSLVILLRRRQRQKRE